MVIWERLGYLLPLAMLPFWTKIPKQQFNFYLYCWIQSTVVFKLCSLSSLFWSVDCRLLFRLYNQLHNRVGVIRRLSWSGLRVPNVHRNESCLENDPGRVSFKLQTNTFMCLGVLSSNKLIPWECFHLNPARIRRSRKRLLFYVIPGSQQSSKLCKD
jgi:hypothetical protein